MSLAVVRSRALLGLNAPEVSVEVHVANGLPAFHIVGLPQASVREARDRVRAALLHCGFEFPNRRLTVNLAPADLPKDSGRFDLPIAVGILAASGQVPSEPLQELELVGELSLTGEIRTIRGALAMVLAVRNDRAARRMVIPDGCSAEAGMVPDGRSLAAATLTDVCEHLRGASPLARIDAAAPSSPASDAAPDLSDVRGQQQARRALEIAAAGGHSLLMVGPPGIGKSMLAHRLPGILPPLTEDEAFEAAALASLAGGFDPRDWGRRPFRAPHHSASAAALVGGGPTPRPGEISLAHRGVLFLDELTEFPPGVLDALREPLEQGRITISRALRQAEFPARFQLVAAMNPCPCGYFGHPGNRCQCPPDRVARYRARLSGPLRDRLDLQLTLPAVSDDALLRAPRGEPSAAVRARVIAAHARQLTRQGTPNAQLDAAGVDAHCAPDAAAQALLHAAIARLGLSARACHRLLAVARTIADLAGSARVEAASVAEALQLRSRDATPA